MGKFYYTVGANIETSYVSFLDKQELHDIKPAQIRAAIQPDAVARVKLFEDESSALAYANSIQKVNSKYTKYPLDYPAIYKVYVLEVPADSEMKQIEVENAKTKKYQLQNLRDVRTITYREIDNAENNVLVFTSDHIYKKDNQDIYIDENYYKQICSQYTDFIEGIKALFDDYAAPAVGFIPKALLNYHFVPDAQQLAKDIHMMAHHSNSPLIEIYQMLKARHQQLIQDPKVNRTGSFVTLIEYAMKRIDAKLNADLVQVNNNNNSQSSSYQNKN